MQADFDIDTKTEFNPKTIFNNWVRASIVSNNELRPHPCGYYPQTIPEDLITKLSAIPYSEASELDYLKIDFLHLSVYDIFENRQEIEEVLKIEPDWSLMLIPSVQKKLFQLSNHGEIIDKLKPKSIHDVADILALIRPGKKNLLKLYMSDKRTRDLLFVKDDNGFTFKKSHAYAYALVIKLQLILIGENII